VLSCYGPELNCKFAALSLGKLPKNKVGHGLPSLRTTAV